jgi:hypothetical protein
MLHLPLQELLQLVDWISTLLALEDPQALFSSQRL